MKTDNIITGHSLTLMSGGFGWIELTDGTNIAGYVYLTDEDPLPPDRLGNKSGRNGTSPYVVMHQRFASLSPMLKILTREKDLRIRLDEEADSKAFLESGRGIVASGGEEDPRII
jgi:hypothetical protein